MNHHGIILKLNKIERNTNNIFNEFFPSNIEARVVYELKPIQYKNLMIISSLIDMVKNDFTSSVFSVIGKNIAEQLFIGKDLEIFFMKVAENVKNATDIIINAREKWNKICEATYEINDDIGNMNGEEIYRYSCIIRSIKDDFLKSIIHIKMLFNEIENLIEQLTEFKELNTTKYLICPITQTNCNKNITKDISKVFVGYQFKSTHYISASLKEIIKESLVDFELFPIFGDDYYEPIHVSCKICMNLQQVDICIFEISDSNPNVMFELGIAYMLGKKSILLAKENSKGTSLSDIAGINLITYNDLVECRKGIKKALQTSQKLQSVIRGREVVEING